MYHSLVAKLLWIAMRVRIDILMTVVYLASKVHCLTQHEFKKLMTSSFFIAVIMLYCCVYPCKSVLQQILDTSYIVTTDDIGPQVFTCGL